MNCASRIQLFFVFVCLMHVSIAQETFRDNFESVSYGNNDGSVNWTANWVEVEPFDIDDDPSRGFVNLNNVAGQLNFFWIWTETITRTANLSGATTATLSFNWETISLETNENISILIAADGVNFTTLASFSGTQSGVFTQNIDAFMAATTTIRFARVGANWSDGGDTARIDNVQIEATFFTDEAPMITVTGNQQFCSTATSAIPVVETVSITDVDDTTLDMLTVQVSTGYQNGQDLLTLTGTHPSITPTWDVGEGRLTLTGPATLAAFEAAVLGVVFSSTPPLVAGLREFSIVLGSPLFLPETGHYYEFIPAVGIQWDNARDAAALRTFFGLQGYLATLTSAIEATFAGDQITGTGWIGASDSFGTGEGEWRWETGPEAGTVFWNGDQNGTTAPGQFSFWNNGEPNDCCGGTSGQENYAHITDDTVGIENSWNDLPIGGGGGVYQAQGYIVEYGGMPGDPTPQIAGVTQLFIQCTMITNRRITHRVKQ